MTTGIWVLGDQLWSEQAALASCEAVKENTPVILIESQSYARKRPYHAQKLVLVWSAMRHFAQELRLAGWQVTYEIADGFETALLRWIRENGIDEVQIMEPSDRSFLRLINKLPISCSIKIVPNNHFLWTKAEFQDWASSRKRLLMEDFYREGRKKFQILIDKNNQPTGGKWNFDKQNRKPPKGKLQTPSRLWFEPDEITLEVIAEIKSKNFTSYGNIDNFLWGVKRSQALAVLEHFLSQCFSNFGSYQDAMVEGEETMWHSLISPYLNLGLLTPKEVIEAAQQAYLENDLELNSVEGFIRQVLGWREYMYGLYHYLPEDYSESNWFNHTEPLPNFFWDSTKTDLNCLHQVLKQVENTGYGHHIQRLMVLSNFALIAGISPQEIEAWFHSTFIDGYDWVMQTNVIGMGQFADGGVLASKPYASSANYINKMSNYCKNCGYDPKQRTGEKACPFNFFYWDFLCRHQDKLTSLGRMGLVLSHLKRIEAEELEEMKALAREWLLSNK